MNPIAEILRDLMTWWSVAVIAFSLAVGLVVLTHRPAGSSTKLLMCPMCSREMHRDWFTPRGCCCDCDEQLSVQKPPVLTTLNPHLLWSAGWKHVPDSSHATDAPACAGPRPSQRFYVW